MRTILLALAAAVSCARAPLLVEGPIELDEQPVVLVLERPLEAEGTRWELCFEFDLPGDSHRAEEIHATFLPSEGDPVPLEDAELDRRGESVVCQIATREAEAGTYDRLKLRSERPLILRSVRGESRP